MKEILIALAAAGVLALDGCQGSAPVKPDAPAAPKAEAPKAEAPAQLTPQASEALAKAVADVKAAEEKKALWTTASDALKQAKAAAAAKDSAAVLKYSAIASEQARLGIEQTGYPPMTIGK